MGSLCNRPQELDNSAPLKKKTQIFAKGKSSMVIFNPGQSFSTLKKGRFNDFYTRQNQLGKGGYGTVYKCLRKSDKQLRAVKIIRKSGQSQEDISGFIKETDILRELSHPNIIKIFEMFEDETSYYLVTELCSGGDLFSKIDNHIRIKNSFSEKQAAEIIEEILRPINYCHSMNIVHRDIKPENLLIDDQGKIKLIDFGTARKVDPVTGIVGIRGTPFYLAPEVIQKVKYNQKCDIWSIGVIMYILLTGDPPFWAEDDKQIFNKIRLGNFDIKPLLKRKLSSSGIELIKRLLAMDPEKRISAEEALNHKWFQQFKVENYQRMDSTATEQVLKNLSKFSQAQKFKRVVFSFITSQSMQGEHREAEALFRKLDLNKDGKLTREELIEGYRPLYGDMTEFEVDTILAAADLDGNGTIDYGEWRAATTKFNSKLSALQIKEAFDFFDRDGSGSISIEELRETLSGRINSDLAQFEKLVKEVDSNGNGEIEFHEFKRMMETFGGEVVNK